MIVVVAAVVVAAVVAAVVVAAVDTSWCKDQLTNNDIHQRSTAADDCCCCWFYIDCPLIAQLTSYMCPSVGGHQDMDRKSATDYLTASPAKSEQPYPQQPENRMR